MTLLDFDCLMIKYHIKNDEKYTCEPRYFVLIRSQRINNKLLNKFICYQDKLHRNLLCNEKIFSESM
ncbi:hypothetical protein A1OE_1223 [Candidatus Endolissoclinum faulkneri L2]|uniref:Uncharacterized protein n=1 Tax=Candidatus Endolissoclinum faulkneri L2 TaxID=1193729 RepID=K7Z5Q3_9PROT|nr:hypothetical protein A1OE_1223 [Candidatus Endolissoclinum faulkneri L2]